jgi:hypothetical protein
MTDGATTFFGDLAQRGEVPLLAKTTGRAQFDLVDGDRIESWLVAVDAGKVTVSPSDGPADATIRVDRALFDRLARGEENAMASILRGAMSCTGDVELLFAIQRLFPGPKASQRAGRSRA